MFVKDMDPGLAFVQNQPMFIWRQIDSFRLRVGLQAMIQQHYSSIIPHHHLNSAFVYMRKVQKLSLGQYPFKTLCTLYTSRVHISNLKSAY